MINKHQCPNGWDTFMSRPKKELVQPAPFRDFGSHDVLDVWMGSILAPDA